MQKARFVHSSLIRLTCLKESICAKYIILSGGRIKTLFFEQVVPASAIPDGWLGLDIGPDSIKIFSDALDTTQTVIWNGPMGVFEFDKFAVGTEVCMQ